VADFYVDGSHGDDGDNGSSWALAKASIGGAITAASNDDTITVAPGLYNESVIVNKALTIQAAQRLTSIIHNSGNTRPVTLQLATGGIALAGLRIMQTYASATQSILYDATTISGTNTVTDCYLGSLFTTANRYGSVHVQRTDLIGCVVDVSLTDSGRALTLRDESTVTGCTVAATSTHGTSRVIRLGAGGDYAITDNVFVLSSNNPYLIATSAPNTLLLDYDRYYPAIDANHEFTIDGTTYTSLAAAQAAGYENNGSEGDPEFADTARKAFFIPKGSALLTAGSSGGRVGAWTGAQTFSAGANAWSAWTGTNCTYVGDQWTLDDGQASGTVLSPVIDLGAAYDVTGLAFDGTQTFPTNIVDTTNAGASPEYQTVEIRGQAASFASGDGTPAWQEVNLNAEASPALGGWRYVQARVTLRSDGS